MRLNKSSSVLRRTQMKEMKAAGGQPATAWTCPQPGWTAASSQPRPSAPAGPAPRFPNQRQAPPLLPGPGPSLPDQDPVGSLPGLQVCCWGRVLAGLVTHQHLSVSAEAEQSCSDQRFPQEQNLLLRQPFVPSCEREGPGHLWGLNGRPRRRLPLFA